MASPFFVGQLVFGERNAEIVMRSSKHAETRQKNKNETFVLRLRKVGMPLRGSDIGLRCG